MNKLVSMRDAAQLLGMTGPDLVRRTRRKLKAIAEERGEIQLFAIGRQWFTTEADMRRLIPELFTFEDGDSLRSLVERQAVELTALRRRIEALENGAWSRRHTQKTLATTKKAT